MTIPATRYFFLLLLVVIGITLGTPSYAAVTCTVSMSALAFGNVDPQSSQTDATATLSYTCTRTGGGFRRSARICFSIGEPGGGPTNPREMHDSGSNTLTFQLYQNASHTVIWGSQFFGSPTPLEIPINSMQRNVPVSGTATLYGRVTAGQTTAIPGYYTDNYLSGDTAVTAQEGPNNNPPNTCSGTALGSHFPFLVSATVVPKCTVTAGLLDFGMASLLAAPVNATTTLGVQCSNGTAYNVGLNAGMNGGGNINARKMLLGSNTVAYQLYRNAGRTQVWGDTIGSNTVAGTGTGNNQPLTVYGRVPAQTTPPPGTYNDIVVVTVTY